MNKTITTVKKHVRAHKTAYAVLATATICLAINRRAMREHDAFLEEKGLTQEFYTGE